MHTKLHLTRFLMVVAMGSMFTACGRMGGGSGGGAAAAPKTDDEKVFYALGLDIAKNVDVFSMSPTELEFVKAGLSDGVTKQKPKVELDTIRPKIFEMARKRQAQRSATEKQRGKDTVEKAAKEPGAERLPSGMVVKTVQKGQ